MMPRVHVAGIGGVGMSALAEFLMDEGIEVSGSDRSFDQRVPVDAIEVLRRAGVRMFPQDGSAITPLVNALAVSTAIEADNPEVAAATRAGVEIVHRAAMLARRAKERSTIAVTGTAGKTTVTGLLGYLLERAGLDPAVVNGGIVLEWAGPARLGNVRAGAGPWFVLEADESDRSLLEFHPAHAIVTNVSKDHFELDEVQSLFRTFGRQVKGVVVAGPGVGEVLERDVIEVPIDPVRTSDGWVFRVEGRDYESCLPGRHNAENAALAVAMAIRLGADAEVVVEALPRFRGIHRRLERVGETRGIVVLDDYAHNPAKIAASWRAAGEGGGRVLGFWRPHGFGPLSLLRHELADALAGAMRPGDRLFVLPVFYAGGTASKDYTSEQFVSDLAARGLDAVAVTGYPELAERLADVARGGDTVLGMGARDPELPRFARRLVGFL